MRSKANIFESICRIFILFHLLKVFTNSIFLLQGNRFLKRLLQIGAINIIFPKYTNYRAYWPVDTGHKLNVHRTFRKRPGRLLNVLYTFNLRPLSMGCCVTGFTYRVYCYSHLIQSR